MKDVLFTGVLVGLSTLLVKPALVTLGFPSDGWERYPALFAIVAIALAAKYFLMAKK
jgi:hypothetical protein